MQARTGNAHQNADARLWSVKGQRVSLSQGKRFITVGIEHVISGIYLFGGWAKNPIFASLLPTRTLTTNGSPKENIQLNGKQNIQSKVMVTMFGLFAEIERDLISERTKEGLAAARAKGKLIGRPKGKGK